MTVYQTENNGHEGVRLPCMVVVFMPDTREGSTMVVIRWQRFMKVNVKKGFVYEYRRA